MKTPNTPNIKYIILALVLTLGVGITSAQTTSSWTVAPASPPDNNVAPPINNGVKGDGTVDANSVQIKYNGLEVRGPLKSFNLFVKGLFVFQGSEPATDNRTGKVLTALDTNGTVGWVSHAGVDAVTSIIAGNNITIESSTDGGRGNVTINAIGSITPQDTAIIGKSTTKLFRNGTWKSIQLSGQMNLTSNSGSDASGAGGYIIKKSRGVSWTAFLGQSGIRAGGTDLPGQTFEDGIDVDGINTLMYKLYDNGDLTVRTGSNVQLVYVVYN